MLAPPPATAAAAFRARVARARRETHDTVTLALTAADGRVPPFAPGQFNMLYAFGVGEVPISISGDPGAPDRLLHTIRAVGPVTRALCGLRAGGMLGVRGPFGAAWPIDAARGRDLVIVAGGIGLAPLRPALLAVASDRSAYERVTLVYGARTPDDLLYRGELSRWRSRLDLDVAVTVDRAIGAWHGHVGVVTTLLARAAFDPASAVAFLCGPEVMMRFAALELRRRGVADARLHVSLERNMRCGLGHCGHCQLGPFFVCKDGPVFRLEAVRPWLDVEEA
jgi:NAD(P)H-flavin reductase